MRTIRTVSRPKGVYVSRESLVILLSTRYPRSTFPFWVTGYYISLVKLLLFSLSFLLPYFPHLHEEPGLTPVHLVILVKNPGQPFYGVTSSQESVTTGVSLSERDTVLSVQCTSDRVSPYFVRTESDCRRGPGRRDRRRRWSLVGPCPLFHSSLPRDAPSFGVSPVATPTDPGLL